MYNNIVNNKVIIGIIILVLLIGVGFIVSRTAPQITESTTQKVSASSEATLTSAGFSPQSLTVKAGSTITWINKSGADATVNSSPHPSHTDYPPLNLGIFPDGGMLSLTFDKAGTYKYHNHLNPSQIGTIVVQ